MHAHGSTIPINIEHVKNTLYCVTKHHTNLLKVQQQQNDDVWAVGMSRASSWGEEAENGAPLLALQLANRFVLTWYFEYRILNIKLYERNIISNCQLVLMIIMCIPEKMISLKNIRTVAVKYTLKYPSTCYHLLCFICNELCSHVAKVEESV